MRFWSKRYLFFIATPSRLIRACEEIFKTYVRSWCDPGSDVGSLAAQHACEPWAQIATKSTSFSRFSNVGVHLSEIGPGSPKDEPLHLLRHMWTMSNTADPSNSNMRIVLSYKWAHCIFEARVIRSSIMECRLKHLLKDKPQIVIVSPGSENDPRFALLKRNVLKNDHIHQKLILNAVYRGQDVLRDDHPSRTQNVMKSQTVPSSDHVVALFTLSGAKMNYFGISIHQVASDMQMWLIPGQHILVLNDDTLLFWDTQFSVHFLHLSKIQPVGQKTHQNHNINGQTRDAHHFRSLIQSWHGFYALVNDCMVPEMLLRGIEGITQAVIVPPRCASIHAAVVSPNMSNFLDHGGMLSSLWMLETQGSNFQAVLSHPAVLDAVTTTTHIQQVAQALGIEAARSAAFCKMKEIFDVEGDESRIQPRHLALIVDYQSHSGQMKPMNRHDMESEHTHGFVSKSLFENNEESTILSSIAAEQAPIHQEICNAALVGEVAKVGTGMVNIVLPTSLDQIEHL
jgi:hypothetical protein